MKFYFFPVCASSRAVWVLCLEQDIPIDLIKIEFQNSEHISAKFSELNPSHTVPVIQDEKNILYQCNSILRYLANKFSLTQWYPQDSAERAKIDQYLDWHISNLKRTSDAALEQVAGYSVATFSFSSEPPRDMDKIAAAMRAYVECLTYLEAHFLNATEFVAGDRLTIADIVASTEIAYYRLLNADISQFPKTSQWLERVTNALNEKGSWKTAHAEFEKFVTSAVDHIKRQQEQQQKFIKKGKDAKGGSKPPDICQTVCFQDSPHDVFSKLTDGAFLTKATGQPCTYNATNAGKFSYANEGITGSNLVFVNDVMVLQSWRSSDWPQGRSCTTKFVLAATPEGGTELTLTQSDIPENFIKKTDDWWIPNFWKPVEGVCTRNVVQQVFFDYASPHELYELLMDTAKLVRFTKSRCEMGRGVGSEFELLDGQIVGRTIELITDARIVWKWRSQDWPANHFSTATIEIKRVQGGSDLLLNQVNVPVDKCRILIENWEKNFWKKMQKEITIK